MSEGDFLEEKASLNLRSLGRGIQIGLTSLRFNDEWIFLAMLASACVSLFAAFILSLDAVEIAAHPNAVLSCDLSSKISCGTVGRSWQAQLFGFPNSFLGLITEPVVITIAVLGLCHVRPPRWFMFTAQVVYFLGLIFAYWLFSQSYWVIGAFCPYCLLITLGTTLVFFTLLRYNVRENNLYLSSTIQAKVERFFRVGGDLLMLAVILSAIAALVLIKLLS